MQYLYLHGFASSHNSVKARYFKQKFAAEGIELKVLDLNLDDFYNLTVTRQLTYMNQVIAGLDSCLIGSSLGALNSLILAEQNPTKIKKLLLLAPALEIKSLWGDIIGIGNIDLWQRSGKLLFQHSAYQGKVPLAYTFVEDLMKLNDRDFSQAIDTLIFHGLNDQVIPIEVSRKYAQNRPYVRTYELNSDHGLEDCLDYIWQQAKPFLFAVN